MPDRGTRYWTMPPRQSVFLAAFAATVAVVLGLRFYRLDTLQAEIFGDINIVWEYLDWILTGLWPTHFVMSAGPIYPYLITPLIALTGPSYFGIKLASVVVSLGALASPTCWCAASPTIASRSSRCSSPESRRGC